MLNYDKLTCAVNVCYMPAGQLQENNNIKKTRINLSSNVGYLRLFAFREFVIYYFSS